MSKYSSPELSVIDTIMDILTVSDGIFEPNPNETPQVPMG